MPNKNHKRKRESPGPPQPPVNRVPTKGAIIAALVSFAAAMYFAGHGSTVTPQGANMLARATADTRLTPHQRRACARAVTQTMNNTPGYTCPAETLTSVYAALHRLSGTTLTTGLHPASTWSSGLCCRFE